MENHPLVSIIVPVYNARPFLAQALDSAIHQTYDNLEIILIDDGSTDGSIEICNSYAQRDKRIVVLRRENKGPGAARNAGLDCAKGDLIAFLDSDDAYDVSFIENMVAAMVREKVDIVVCRYSLHELTSDTDMGKWTKTEPKLRAGRYDRDAAIRALYDGTLNFSIWNKLYTREMWETQRFQEGRVYEDVEITYRIYARSRSVFMLDKILYMYRRRPSSITTQTVTIKTIKDRLQSRIRSEAFICENTPEIFTTEQMEAYKQKRLDGMAHYYSVLYFFSKEERAELEKKLRGDIIAAGAEIKPKKPGTKVVFFMARSCPGLFGAVMTAYHSAKKGGKRIFKRK